MRSAAWAIAAPLILNPVKSNHFLPYVFMKYDVGQLMMFSCVMKLAPAMEIIQRMTSAQARRPGSAAIAEVSTTLQERWTIADVTTIRHKAA